jgi:phospholipid/cholesterol/gamma-HCH transport system substrate-binding protein
MSDMTVTADTRRNIRIGIFTVLALGIFGFALLIVGKKSGFFIASYRIYGEFEQVGGLAVGQPVWLSGLEIGLVEGIDLAGPDSSKIRVTMAIQSRYQDWIRSDSKALLDSKGLLGDKIVNITPGSPAGKILAEGEQIETSPPVDLGAVMSETGRIIGSIGGLVDEVTNLTKSLQRGEGSLGQLIADDKLYRETAGAVEGLNSFVRELNAGRGTFGKLAVDEALYDELTKSADALSGVLLGLERGEGSLGAVLSKPDLHDDTRRLLESVDELVGGDNELIADIKENPKKYFKVSVF